MSRTRRSLSLTDGRFQMALILRVLMHWSLFAVVVLLVLFCWQFVTGDSSLGLQSNLRNMWQRYAPAFMVLFALLPIVIYDTVKLSNRLVGPLLRLRRATRSLIEGEWVTPIRFREGDFCQDLAEDFNILLDRWQQPGRVENSTEAVEYSIQS